MKFILVNHRTPSRPSNCIQCARSLGAGYLRDVSTQRRYCDHDCYRRYQAKSLFMPWLAVTGADQGPVTNYPAQLETIAALATGLCWCYAIPITAVSISLMEVALRMHEPATVEGLPAAIPS